MIWASLLVIGGTLAVILVNLGESGGELHLGFEQMIHARTPWLLLALLWGGAALGVASLFGKRRLLKLPVVGVELALAALFSWYVAEFSILPAHELALGVGDPFPSYSLPDEEGELHTYAAGAPRQATLFVFYRGDW